MPLLDAAGNISIGLQWLSLRCTAPRGNGQQESHLFSSVLQLFIYSLEPPVLSLGNNEHNCPQRHPSLNNTTIFTFYRYKIMTPDSPSFTLFPKLPPELRTQIWQQALPIIGPALCRYREGLWHRRFLRPGDEGHFPELEDYIELEFRPDLVIQISVELPLILVNHEARSVTLEWARKNGVKIPPGSDNHTCMRPFDPELDVIYIEISQMMDFFRAPHERMFEDDSVGRIISSSKRPKRLAISKMTFRDNYLIYDILFKYNYASHLFVIAGEQPDFEGLWEVDSSQGKSMFWNYRRLRFETRDGEYITDKGLYPTIEENERGLSEDLSHFTDLEIRPAFAVRR
ncbi:hypothetical protein LCI18_011424 [Fusarium solani-melongenae]|uniref:Uncharacterized protein n=1 Tax=Fusarium solani subsp. cucurbitae TaxID=2747967 RepID=A0ACD3ZGS9_FUSSC|nr:hypothetical protein LCI18_011424 [Fusarium solani-melongenae]